MSSVAICIPTYNQAPYLERAVRSALSQSVPCEIWISDDASTDETPEVMTRLCAEFPQIKHFRQHKNLGMSGNPRWIVQQPVTDFIVKLDSDDELDLEYVAELLALLEVHPTAGYGHVSVQEIDGEGRKQKLRLLARKTGFQSPEENLRSSVLGYRVAANICMFRRSALQQVDYYRHDLAFADDWDLAVRLADAGWGNVHVSAVLASYRVWVTPVRSRRKLAELEGCRRVFDQALIPAFARRSWPLIPIKNARRRLALRHAEILHEGKFTEAEREELRQGLIRLGDSPVLRWKFCWISTPFAPLFQFPSSLKATMRAWLKAAIFKTLS